MLLMNYSADVACLVLSCRVSPVGVKLVHTFGVLVEEAQEASLVLSTDVLVLT